MTYASEVLADSPWGAWATNETSGTSLADYSGNSRALTLNGTVTLAQTGPDGSTANAISFPDANDGSEEYAVSSVNFNSVTATFEAWVYLTAYPSTKTPIVAQGASYGVGGSDKYLYIGTDGKPNFYIFNSGQLTVTGSTALTLNAWNHVVASVGGSGTKIRVNKSTTGSDANTGSSGTNSKVFLRGGGIDGTGGNAIDGTNGGPVTIALPAAYSTQLSDARTDAHFDAMAIPDATVNAARGTGTALALVPSVSAVQSPTVAAATGVATATGPAPTFTSASSPTVNPPAATATASAAAAEFVELFELETNVSNAVAGRRRDGLGVVSVSVPPTAVPTTTRVDKAVPLPVPTLVNGRVT